MNFEFDEKEIVQHALSNDVNLKIAIQVGLSFEELKRTLIRNFADIIEIELNQHKWRKLDVDFWRKEPTGSYTGIYCERQDWPENISVCIEAQTAGIRKYLIGVAANNDKVDNKYRQIIYETLNKEIGNGSQSNGWAWYRDLSEYSDFGTKETLLALYEKKQMCDDLSKQIIRIADVVSIAFIKSQ